MAKFHGEQYAEVAWRAEDVKSLRASWSMEKCEEELGRISNRMADRCTELGWEVMECLLAGANEDGGHEDFCEKEDDINADCTCGNDVDFFIAKVAEVNAEAALCNWGWEIFERNGRYSIGREDTTDIFADDQAALDYVTAEAKGGSGVHKLALQLVEDGHSEE